jgi:hypothetical protein
MGSGSVEKRRGTAKKAESVRIETAQFTGVNTSHLSGSIFDGFRETLVRIIGYI